MNVLITGASGFLGGYCAEALIHHGHKVTALVRPTSRTNHLKSLGVRLQPASNLDLRGADVIIHAAAKTEPLGPWPEFVTGTIENTRQLLTAAVSAGIPHFIHISSRGIYERPARDSLIYDETTPYGHPHRWSYYARAKIAAEQLVRAASIATTIFRPTWMYGPRDTMIFGRVVTALAARRVKWVGDGNSLINLIHVADAAAAVVRATTDPRARGQIYNLADDEHSPTQRQFLTRVCELLDLPIPSGTLDFRLAYRLGFLSECVAHATGFRVCPPVTRHAVLLQGGYRRYSNAKLRTELDWQPQVDFETGLRATAEWYRAQTITPSAHHTPAPSH